MNRVGYTVVKSKCLGGGPWLGGACAEMRDDVGVVKGGKCRRRGVVSDGLGS